MSLGDQAVVEAARRAAALGLVQDLLHKVFVGELLSASDHSTTNLMLLWERAHQINPACAYAISREGAMKK